MTSIPKPASYETPDTMLLWGNFLRYKPGFSYDRKIWRAGTVADGSCFFHALCMATNPHYRSLPREPREKGENMRKQMVKEIRKALASKLTMAEWSELQGGAPAEFANDSTIREIESNVYKVLVNPEKYQNSASRSWIFDIFSRDFYSMMLIPRCLGRDVFGLDSRDKDVEVWRKNRYNKFVEEMSRLPQNTINSLGTNRIRNSANAFYELLNVSEKRSNLISFEMAKKHIGGQDWIGTEFLPFFEKHFGVRIAIIDGETGLPYISDFQKENKDDKRDVALILATQSHYECLGVEEIEGSQKKLRCRHPCDSPVVLSYERSLQHQRLRTQDPGLYDIAKLSELDDGNDSDVSDSYRSPT